MLIIKKLTRISFYLFLLSFPTQLGKHFWLKNSFLDAYRLDYLSLTLYLSDLFLFLYLFFFYLNFRSHFSIKNHLKYLLPLLILLLLQTPFLSFKIQQTFFLIKITLLFFYSLTIPKLKPNPKIVIYIFLFQILFLFFLSLSQILLQKSVGGPFYFFGERTFYLFTPQIAQQSFLGHLFLRPYATFSHPNALSAYLLLITLYIFLFSKKIKNSFLKKIIPTVYLAVFILLFLSHSQNTWLTTLIIVFLLFKRPLNAKKTLFLKAAFFFSFLSPFFLLILGTFSRQPDSLIIRNLIFQKIFQQNPLQLLFGLGFFDQFSIYGNSKNLIQTFQPIHNSIWLLISSLGLIFIVFFYIYFKENKFTSSLKISSNGFYILIAILLLSSFDHYFITSPQNLFLLAFLLPHCFNTRI